MSYEKISKYMSMILRHRPETIGITLDEHGWADVDELIEGIAAKKKFNREILEEIVRTDKKQRYSFNEDKTRIRANQGHSIPVESGSGGRRSLRKYCGMELRRNMWLRLTEQGSDRETACMCICRRMSRPLNRWDGVMAGR